jgi:NADH dehydrogenase FAD-containing subunit
VRATATRLVLVGVGHAHLEVLRRLSRQRPADVDLAVISPGPLHHYSGMAPGYLRGTYRLEEIAVELAPLVGAAGGRLLLGRAVGFDPRRRVVEVEQVGTAGGPGGCADSGSLARNGGGRIEIPYDLVSFAVGSDAAGAAAAAARAGGAVLSCKPIGRVVELRRRLLAMAGRRQAAETVVVVGGGAAGVEMALAAAGGFAAAAAPHRVILVEAGPAILAGRSPRCQRRARGILARRGVELRTGSPVAEINPVAPSAPIRQGKPAEAAEPAGGAPDSAATAAASVRLGSGEELHCNLVVWATAAVGWPLFRDSGLPLDGRGFLLIDRTLRSVADPRVFAAGDCGTLADFPTTPKAGVYAVREGPILYRSLRAALAGGNPPRYRPQRGFLIILNTGDGRALLSYKGLVSYGRWAFRLKDAIDRRFLARYR